MMQYSITTHTCHGRTFSFLLHTKLLPTECISSTVKYLVSLDTPQFAIEGVGFEGEDPYLYTASFEGAEPKVGEMTQKQLFGSDDFTYSLGSYSSISDNTVLFTNGDFCDPIGTGRSASIQFLRAENGDAIDCMNLLAEYVEETRVCVYEMTVRISKQCCNTYLNAFPS